MASASPAGQVADRSSDLLENLDDAGSVYLSPHHDDICFSLGGLAARRRGGWLVNLFTRSAYSVTPSPGPSPDVEAITRLRTEEDNAFAAVCGLTRIDLGLAEPPLHGRNVWDLSHVAEDRSVLEGPLAACLRRIAANAGGKRYTLFCPSGIGNHVNHVATMMTIVGSLPELQRRYRVLFYEDLHYASNWRARQVGLLRLFAAMSGHRARRLTITLGDEAKAKLALIQLYRSQFAQLPQSCHGFSPSVPGAAPKLHEAVWEFMAGRASRSAG